MQDDFRRPVCQTAEHGFVAKIWSLFRPTNEKYLHLRLNGKHNHHVSGCGCGSVGRAVESDIRGPGSNPVFGKFNIHLPTVSCSEKTKIYI